MVHCVSFGHSLWFFFGDILGGRFRDLYYDLLVISDFFLGFCLIDFILVHLGDSCFPLFDFRIMGILNRFINYYYHYLLYRLF